MVFLGIRIVCDSGCGWVFRVLIWMKSGVGLGSRVGVVFVSIPVVVKAMVKAMVPVNMVSSFPFLKYFVRFVCAGL